VVTFVVAVPLPFVTKQVCPEGCVRTVTAYAAPLSRALEKVKLPLVETDKLLPPLSCKTSPEPVSPDTFPPTV
jgi:hypothetical protein